MPDITIKNSFPDEYQISIEGSPNDDDVSPLRLSDTYAQRVQVEVLDVIAHKAELISLNLNKLV